MKQIVYICNGKDEKCSKTGCYLKGGPCCHTSDVTYAKNFETNGDSFYFEKEEKNSRENPTL